MPLFKVHPAPTGDSPTDHGKPCQTGPKGPMPAHWKGTGDVKILFFCLAVEIEVQSGPITIQFTATADAWLLSAAYEMCIVTT